MTLTPRDGAALGPRARAFPFPSHYPFPLPLPLPLSVGHQSKIGTDMTREDATALGLATP